MLKLQYIVVCAIFVVFAIANAQGPPGLLISGAMKNGVKKLGEQCMKSVGATMDEMESIKHGPPYKGKASCAVACILEKGGVMANKKFSKNGLLKVVTPFLFGDTKKINHIKSIANACENETKTEDTNECTNGENIIICLRKQIPQIKELDL